MAKEKQKQQIVRINSLSKTLDTIQAFAKQMGNKDQKKGVEMALNAIRQTYGIPLDGEQLKLF